MFQLAPTFGSSRVKWKVCLNGRRKFGVWVCGFSEMVVEPAPNSRVLSCVVVWVATPLARAA